AVLSFRRRALPPPGPGRDRPGGARRAVAAPACPWRKHCPICGQTTHRGPPRPRGVAEHRQVRHPAFFLLFELESMTVHAFICDAIRTPFGRYGGALAPVRADDLAAVPIKALMARNPGVHWDELNA